MQCLSENCKKWVFQQIRNTMSQAIPDSVIQDALDNSRYNVLDALKVCEAYVEHRQTCICRMDRQTYLTMALVLRNTFPKITEINVKKLIFNHKDDLIGATLEYATEGVRKHRRIKRRRCEDIDKRKDNQWDAINLGS